MFKGVSGAAVFFGERDLAAAHEAALDPENPHMGEPWAGAAENTSRVIAKFWCGLPVRAASCHPPHHKAVALVSLLHSAGPPPAVRLPQRTRRFLLIFP